MDLIKYDHFLHNERRLEQFFLHYFIKAAARTRRT